MIALVTIAIVLGADALRFLILSRCPSRSLVAENRFLRRRLALSKESGNKPRRIDSATRINLAVLAKLFDYEAEFLVLGQVPYSGDQIGARRTAYEYVLAAATG